MAYQSDVDYSARKAELKKQIDATTNAAEKAQLQAQYDAADQSRIEKLASNLTKYGKFASDSELDSAAGLMAQNQIGTGYETQKENLNKSYDTAKQNANNDALSRGMGRDTYVLDRMATLDSNRANALSSVDAAKANAIQAAKQAILNNYQTNQANALADEKGEFAQNIMAYYNDYQAEISRVQGNNDSTDDWKIPYLQAARNQKILAQQEAAAKATKGSGGGSAKSTTMTYSQLNSAIKDMYERGTDDTALYNYISKYGGEYAGQLLDMYGLTGNGRKSPDLLSDAAADQAVGMNRGSEGQVATVQRLLNAGQITEAQANALIKKFNLG